jgi:DNA polymerase-3 subunit alpha
MSTEFTHLHVHTEFSLLDGAIGLEKLIEQAKRQQLTSLAITDHGNIFGAVKFAQLCKKNGIKPIIGMEAYFTEDATIKDPQNKYYHLILLVQNETGYKNLCKLISYSYQEGFYFKPRIDYAMLKKHAEGLIVTSACLGGHIPQLIKNDQLDVAKKQIQWFLDVFGRDRFYLEVQPEEQDEQKVVNRAIFALCKEMDIQPVAATDCHYLSLDDHEAHEIMLAIQTGKQFDDPGRFSFGECRAYMRSKEEMLAIFPNNPEAVYNTGKIAEMCNFEFETGKLFFPKFEIPDNKTDVEYFKELCWAGLDKLIQNKRIDLVELEKYQQRLTTEIDLIVTMGFIGYFLIVSDFIMWARATGIPVGPGRGSAAGALVAWCLEITNIDPLKYNLLFERFLNPERVSMPDIDIDFCIEGRETVINYIRDKYGHDKVCQIITFGTMMAKGVLKDVARVLGFPFEDSNMISALIPDQLKISLAESLEQEPQLQQLIDSNPKIKHLFDIAFKLEGITRHASKHAAGIVITPEPIDSMLPVYIPPKTNELVSQYAMTELESLGFLKIDLLGLKNLTLVKKAVNLIRESHNIEIDIDHIPLDDAKTFELLQAGRTSGVFQLESSGIKDVLRKLKPEKFEDIIAVNALYRPGPLGSGMVDDFILRKHGKQKIDYFFSELEPVLQETYGVIVYQEQVMKIASTIAGFSLGESDILRRAMGKKKADVMAEQKQIFTDRARERNFDAKKAEQLFDLIAYFAGYGFNKSHSAAYALIAFQTAYLKANYPAEFSAALISLEANNAEKLAFYLKETRDIGITILPPNINTSAIDFTVVQGQVLFGLLGIKNIGTRSLENIIEERGKNGPFKDLLDFCSRIDLRTSNKRVLENLICAGAFDTLPGSRPQQFEELQSIMALAVDHKKRLLTGQMQLFGERQDPNSNQSYAFTTATKWTDKERLEKEKEVLGFYISSHPLEGYQHQIASLNLESFQKMITRMASLSAGAEEPVVIGCGLLQSKREISTKKGDRMAFVQLEDLEANAEIIIFPRLYKQAAEWMNSGQHTIFVVKGNLDLAHANQCKIKAQEFIPIDILFENIKQIFHAEFYLPETATVEHAEELNRALQPGKTKIDIFVQEQASTFKIQAKKKFTVDFKTINQLLQHQIKTKVFI